MSRPGSLSAGRDSPCGPAERQTEDERERGETAPEGRRESSDKSWLSLASGNYLHDKATAGNRSGIADKTEDKGSTVGKKGRKKTKRKKVCLVHKNRDEGRFECEHCRPIPD